MRTDQTLVKQLILSLSGESEPDSFVLLQAMHYCEIRYGKRVKTGNEPELIELCAAAYLYFKELSQVYGNDEAEVYEISLGELTVKEKNGFRLRLAYKMFSEALKKAEAAGFLGEQGDFFFAGVMA